MANKVIKTPITLTVMLFLLSGAAFPLEETYAEIFKDFPRFVDKLLADWHVPGAAIGVVKDGKIRE